MFTARYALYLYIHLQHNSAPTKCHSSLCNSSTQGQYAQCPFLCAAPSKYLLTASLCPIADSRLCLSKSLASLLTDNLAQYSLTTHPSPFPPVPLCVFSWRPEQIAVVRFEIPTPWRHTMAAHFRLLKFVCLGIFRSLETKMMFQIWDNPWCGDVTNKCT